MRTARTLNVDVGRRVFRVRGLHARRVNKLFLVSELLREPHPDAKPAGRTYVTPGGPPELDRPRFSEGQFFQASRRPVIVKVMR